MSGSESEPSNKRKRARARAPVAAQPAELANAVAVVADETKAAPEKPAERAGRRVAARAPAARARRAGARDAAQPAPAAEPAVHDMERDLAGLLSDVDGAEGDADERRRAAEAIARIAARLYPQAHGAVQPDDGLLSSARQLLSTDYYLQQLGRIGQGARSEQVDDFGLDAAYEARIQPLLDMLYESYFRVRIDGAQHIPKHGPALLVCNHGGTLPWDGVMLKTALRHTVPGRPALRWLTDDHVFHAPFLGACLNRLGAVRACPENADRLLARGDLLAVFPEGVKGVSKLFKERYQLQRFGRGGHIKLALRMGVPLIPLAIVGAEESYPLVYKFRAFSKLLGLPFIPVTPLFPWLGPLGLLPLPSRWQIVVGEPMHEFAGRGPDAAEDTVLVSDLNEQLRSKVHTLVQEALRTRGQSVFFG